MHHPDLQLASTSHPADAVVLSLPPSVIQPVVPVVASLDASDQPTLSQESVLSTGAEAGNLSTDDHKHDQTSA